MSELMSNNVKEGVLVVSNLKIRERKKSLASQKKPLKAGAAMCHGRLGHNFVEVIKNIGGTASTYGATKSFVSNRFRR